jgi:hypothetical protein
MKASLLSSTAPSVPVQVLSKPGNGNGSKSIRGRGLGHRPFADRLNLAVTVATGERSLDPSLGQIATAFRVSPAQLREAIKARRNGDGNGHVTVTDVVAKDLIRAAVAEVGMSKVIDLLSEVDGE